MEVNLLSHQYEMIADTMSPLITMVAGLGSGKTTASIYKALHLAQQCPPSVPGMIVEPTYPMARDVLKPCMDEILTRLEIPFTFHRADFNYLLHFAGGARELRIRNGEQPQRLAGTNLGYAVLDEAAQQREETFKIVNSRVRHPDAPVRQVILVGTPEGYNYFFRIAEAEKKESTHTIRARTTDNDFLPDDYIDRLGHFSEEERKKYINGEFIAAGGRVYSHFSRTKHVRKCEDITRGNIFMFCDFNIANQHWVFAKEVSGVIHLWSELVGINQNTIDQSQEAVSHLSAFGLSPSDVTVICDAAGSSRQTSATMSDVLLLRQAGFIVRHPAKNPAIRDRTYSVNQALANGALFFDGAVENTIQAFEQQGFDKMGYPDKTRGHDHAADSVGYGVHFLNPIRMPRANQYSYYH